jgi:hypothetical protein
MKSEPPRPPIVGPTAADWEVIKRSCASDYDGHTGFAQMTPAARLAWLEDAVEFVAQYSGRRASAGASQFPPDYRSQTPTGVSDPGYNG